MESVPVEGLYWVQFGYPIRREWTTSLEACGVLVLEWFREHTLMVDAPTQEAVRECDAVSPFLATIEVVLSTDRARPEALEFRGLVVEALSLRSSVEQVLADLPGAELVEVIEPTTNPHITTYVFSGSGATEELLRSSYLFSAVSEPPTPEPSDERQALVLARRWNATTGEPDASKSYVNDFLAPRGLNNATNLPAIAVLDTGIGPTPLHAEFSTALKGSINCIDTDIPGPLGQCQVNHLMDDNRGHGTLVASTALGRGVAGGDDGSYRRGQGVSPYSDLWAAKFIDYKSTNSCNRETQGNVSVRRQGFEYVRWNSATGADRALVANYSGNLSTAGTPSYGSLSREWDDYVLDAARIIEPTNPSHLQPMTIVVSGGNTPVGVACQVSDPALGKNVIAVGSVDQFDNWPSGGDSCTELTSPTDSLDGPHVVSEFSCPGAPFGPGGSGVHLVRVKPDLVAPGWRVDGARPTGMTCEGSICGQIPGAGTYSYTRGTSFSAPAVAGAAALAIKDLRDDGVVDPKPSLVKAGLIATASSLTPGGGPCTDCRPSPTYGWGLVDLDRLTGSTPRWVFNEAHAFTAVGQGWVSPLLKRASKGLPVLVALVWSDPNTINSPVLRRDLDLTLAVAGGNLYWVGNNFNENKTGVDDGWSYAYGWPWGPVDDDVNTVEAVFVSPTESISLAYGFQISVAIETMTTFSPPSPFETQRFSVYVWNAVPCVGLSC